MNQRDPGPQATKAEREMWRLAQIQPHEFEPNDHGYCSLCGVGLVDHADAQVRRHNLFKTYQKGVGVARALRLPKTTLVFLGRGEVELRVGTWVYQALWRWPLVVWGEWEGPSENMDPEGYYHLHIWYDHLWWRRFLPNRLKWRPWPRAGGTGPGGNSTWVGMPIFSWVGWGPLELRRFKRETIEEAERTYGRSDGRS